jgi:hypothetical protein
MTLIRINNRFVNLDHVVDAQYAPAQPAGEDEDGPVKERPAELALYTSVPEVQSEGTEDNGVGMIGTEQVKLVFRGKEAARLHEIMCSMCEVQVEKDRETLYRIPR